MLYTNVGDMSIDVLPLVSAKMFFGFTKIQNVGDTVKIT